MGVINSLTPDFDVRAVQNNATAAKYAGHRIPVMLLISSLERGGAERQVVELANNLNPRRFDVTVCSLSTHVPLADGLSHRAQRLKIVPKRWRFDVSTIPQVNKIIRQRRIQIVHAFLFDAEMVARICGRLLDVPVVIASERNTDYQRPWIHTLCHKITRSWCDGMIANSQSGRQFSIRTLRLPSQSVFVIRNGVDVNRFQPMDVTTLRKQLLISPSSPVVGMVASFKRQKRHEDFFETARRVIRAVPDARFICVGETLRDNLQGSADYHREIKNLLQDRLLKERCLLLGQRDDMPHVYNLCDATVLTSVREGTPNVLLESMACEVPVVATNVSDNAYVIPNARAGYLVNVGDVQDMAERVLGLLHDPIKRRNMGRTAREWVIQEFSVSALTRRTEAVYLSLLKKKRKLTYNPLFSAEPPCPAAT